MTADEVLDLFERIQIRWPNWRAPADLDLGVEIYLEDLEAFEYEDVKAFYKSLKGERFCPTLSEVVEALDGSPMGEPWMTRKAGGMGFFEKPVS